MDFIASLWVLWVIVFGAGLAGVLAGYILMMFDPLMLFLGIFGGFKGYFKVCCYCENNVLIYAHQKSVSFNSSQAVGLLCQ